MDLLFPLLDRPRALGSARSGRWTFLACGLLLASGVALEAAPARAAPISSITYAVTGGTVTWSAPVVGVATITGGSVEVIPIPYAVSASVACGPGIFYCAGVNAIVQTTGVYSATLGFGIPLTKFHIKTSSGLTGVWPTLTATTTSGTLMLFAGNVDLVPGSYVDASHSGTYGSVHYAIAWHVQLGSEVRTLVPVVPEPTTGALLGLGLGTLAMTGAAGGLLRTRRLRRR